MKLRDATPADLDALVALEEACYPPAQAYSRAEYAYALTQAKAVNLVAEDARGIVGYVGAFHHRAKRLGHVITLNVHADSRRRGLGRALLSECHARLQALGMRGCALEVNVDNRAAIALYEALGYVRLGRIRGYYHGYADNDAWRYLLRW